MQSHLLKTCCPTEISQENFSICTRFSPTQNNCKLSCSKLLRQYATISTQIPSVRRSHLTARHTAVRCTQAPSLPSATHRVCRCSVVFNTSSPTAHFTYHPHMQHNRRVAGCPKSFSVRLLYNHLY
jgi:hypothetical protein